MKQFTIISLISFWAWVGMLSCEKSLETSNQMESADSLPPVVVSDTEILYSDSLTIQMKLEAPKIIEYSQLDTPYTEFTKGIRVEFYRDSMHVESSLEADYAIYYQDKDLWEYKGNVELLNQQGDRLNTNHLYADRDEEKIYSTEYVSITSPDGTKINGAGGFESNLRFTEYEFKDVSGKINQ